MKDQIDTNYPSFEFLKARSEKRIPRFAFEYLTGGCNEEINLLRNRTDVQEVQLMPQYLNDFLGCDMQTTLFGHTYDAPFGMAPIGLQGLMYPNAPEILAKAAFEQNIPFILSTVTTSSIETIAAITEGRAWFQLYHPAKDELRDDLLQRAHDAEMPVLVALSDVPTFGYRPKAVSYTHLTLPTKA